MTNEELVSAIRNGNKKACVQLWEQVEKLIKKYAYAYYNNLRLSGREYIPDAEDFISEGYTAMLEAVKYYSSDRGYCYTTYLVKALKTAFSAVAGLRTSRTINEPLNCCGSLDIAVDSESEDTKFIDVLADKTAQNDFKRVELSETQRIVAEALAELNEQDRQLIKMRYWNEMSFNAVAKVRGVSSQAVIARERKILRKLRLNSSLKELYGEFKLHYNGIEI